MLIKALIVTISAFLLPVNNAVADCWLGKPSTQVRVAAVVDGDTLRLVDGRKVRILGINTPELGRDGRKDQPLAKAAKTAVEDMLDASGRAWIIVGEQKRDRYGRLLAHVYTRADGGSVAALLLEQGLAFPVIRPPDVELASCLLSAAKIGKRQVQSVWRIPTFSVSSDGALAGGFILLGGRLLDVSVGGKSWWLRLNGNAVLQIKPASQAYFSFEDLSNLVGTQLSVMGWLAKRKGGHKDGYADWIMTVYHSSALSIDL